MSPVFPWNDGAVFTRGKSAYNLATDVNCPGHLQDRLVYPPGHSLQAVERVVDLQCRQCSVSPFGLLNLAGCLHIVNLLS